MPQRSMYGTGGWATGEPSSKAEAVHREPQDPDGVTHQGKSTSSSHLLCTRIVFTLQDDLMSSLGEGSAGSCMQVHQYQPMRQGFRCSGEPLREGKACMVQCSPPGAIRSSIFT